jgi:hypothetical protein
MSRKDLVELNKNIQELMLMEALAEDLQCRIESVPNNIGSDAENSMQVVCANIELAKVRLFQSFNNMIRVMEPDEVISVLQEQLGLLDKLDKEFKESGQE